MVKYLKDLVALSRQRGVSTLPTMLLLGGIIIEIAIAIAFLTYYYNNINFASRLTAEALEAARAGADDATIKVVRDKTCPNAACPSPYQVISANGRVADVIICKDTCLGNGTTQIISTASVGNRVRVVEADLNVDSVTGQVTVTALYEK